MSGSGLSRQAESLGLDENEAAELFGAAAANDRAAAALIDRLGDRLGAAIATAVNLLNPDVVVIGGGVAQSGEPLLSRVRMALERYALESHRRRLRVVAAALGAEAGVVGAGLLVWDARRLTKAARATVTGRST
jgi:glucokinase